MIARNFNKLMEEIGLKIDTVLQMERTITACLIRRFAEAGPVRGQRRHFHSGQGWRHQREQIERLYARNLPISAELVKICRALGNTRLWHISQTAD